MIVTTVNRLFFLLALLFCCNIAQAAITVDSVTVKPSNCANDGSIDVYAHSPSSMLYAIISGPDLRPPQNGSQFGALPAGTYQVIVTNFSNDTAFTIATVGGNYMFPDFAPTYANPVCAGTSTGIIVGNALPIGKSPFTWLLTDLGTNVTITQTADSFFNVPAGNYSIRQFDSCNNFATRYVTLADPVHAFTISNINNRLIHCDTVELRMQLFINGGNYALPYTLQVQTPSGTFQVPMDFFSGGYYPEIQAKVGGVTYGDYCNITVTDGCGNVQYSANTINQFTLQVNYSMVTDSCQNKAGAYLSLHNTALLPNVWPTYINGPVKVILYNATTGAAIDSTLTGSLDTAVFSAFSTYATPGTTYNIKLIDGCGNMYNSSVQMPAVLPPYNVHFFTGSACFDSTNTYAFQWFNFFTSPPTFELLSGPPVIKSTKPKYAYTDGITYPQTHPANLGGNSANGDYLHYVELVNVGVGTYHYRVYDSCGHSITDSFTVTPQDVTDFGYSFSYTKGCPGQNKINMTRTTNLTDYANFIINMGNTGLPVYYNKSDTAINLNSGTYTIQINYYRPTTALQVNDSLYCNAVFDTIVIPPYDLPKIDYATQIRCNGTVNVGLQPDSGKGIPPYTYEILSGPQTAAVQASNFFTLTQPGHYTARISDVCGFARTFNFFVDTLSFKQIVKIGSSCIGNSTTLIAEHSPYATYVWNKPNGTTYIGDTLHVNPVTPADYGIYNIIKIVSVNNCRDTFYTIYNLTSSSINNINQTICMGDTFPFNGSMLTQTGMYYDTILATPCDSIIELNLTVQTAAVDSSAQTICTGQSITLGGNIYSATGVYRDTLTSTAGCDSVVVINLTVSDYKRDSVAQTICFGQIITVGTHTYSATGIYHDTITTTTCDSIYILNLTVEAEKRDSVNATICAGQSVTVGAHVYTVTGIFRDTIITATCDSIHILNLQVGTYKRDSLAQTICEGDSFTLGVNTYYNGGIYRDTFSTVGCDSIFTLNLLVNATKRDTLNRTMCSDESITIGTHTYNTAGVYSDTLNTTLGCDSIVLLNLQVTDSKYDTAQYGFCEGQSITVNGHTYIQAGIYNDTLSTTTCDSILTVYITVYPNPVFQISPDDTTLISGQALQLNTVADSVYEYYWNTYNGIVINDAYVQTPLATVYNSGWITAEATTGDNCTVTDSIFITSTHCTEAILVPNAFTPNGDGHNDDFRVFGNCIRVSVVRVFNRWGEKVWETNDMESGWDGTYKGKLQMPGVYVYVVNYFSSAKQEDIEKSLKGSLTLIR